MFLQEGNLIFHDINLLHYNNKILFILRQCWSWASCFFMRGRLARLTSFRAVSRWWLLLFSTVLASWLWPCMLMGNGLRVTRPSRSLLITWIGLRRCFCGFIRLGFDQRRIILVFFRVRLCTIVFFVAFTWKSGVFVSLSSIFFSTFWVSHWVFWTCFRVIFWSYRLLRTWWCFLMIFVFSQALSSVYPWTIVSTSKISLL